MWDWAEESTTTPFVRSLLIDLRDMVWKLRREKEEMVAAVVDAREKLEETRAEKEAELQAARLAMQAKDHEVVVLGERVNELDRQRAILLYALAVCIGLLMFCMLKTNVL